MITAVRTLSIHYPGYIIILFLDAVFLSQNSIFMRQISCSVYDRRCQLASCCLHSVTYLTQCYPVGTCDKLIEKYGLSMFLELTI